MIGRMTKGRRRGRRREHEERMLKELLEEKGSLILASWKGRGREFDKEKEKSGGQEGVVGTETQTEGRRVDGCSPGKERRELKEYRKGGDKATPEED